RDAPKELPYLLCDRNVRYTPSSSALLWVARHPHDPSLWEKDFFLLGDPDFGANAEAASAFAARAADAVRGAHFARLAQTRDEVISLAESCLQDSEAPLRPVLSSLRSGHLSGSRFELYLGSSASKAAFMQDLRKYRFVHLATHGFFDTEFP